MPYKLYVVYEHDYDITIILGVITEDKFSEFCQWYVECTRDRIEVYNAEIFETRHEPGKFFSIKIKYPSDVFEWDYTFYYHEIVINEFCND